MAILWMDGFDLYNGAQPNIGLTGRYTSQATTAETNTYVNLITGRFGGQAMQFEAPAAGVSTTGQPLIIVTLGSSYSAGSFNAALYVENLSQFTTSISGNTVVRIANGANRVFDIKLFDTGEIVLVNSAGTELGRSAVGTVINSMWYYLQFEFTLSTTVGTASLKLDGDDLFSPLTGLNTGQTQWNTFEFWWGEDGGYGWTAWDDLYLTDGASLGERRIGTQRPNADTAQKDFTPSTGSTNYPMVDDTTCDGDATYVESNVVGDLDLYDIVSLSGTPTSVSAVQLVSFAKKTDASTRTFNLAVKSGGTSSNGSAQTLASNYKWFGRLLETDPNTSTTWAASAVNALQIGPRIAS